MDNINKQKFLAELGRLLTFMYEDDRQTALAMYGRMFDETADETGLLELLVSPTRQAVVLARSYDAKARKIQIEAQEADILSTPDNAPAFIFAIDKVAQQAAELGVKEAAVSEGQFSIFDQLPELEDILAEPAAEKKAEPVALPELEDAVAVDTAVEAAAEEDAEEAERSSVDETADAVDAFLADFTIANGELISLKAESESLKAEEEDENTDAEDILAEAENSHAAEAEGSQAPVKTRVKTNILLLIFYIFLAIPVGLLGVAILLLPTVFSLGLAVTCAYCGVFVLGMCFGSFAVIADTLAVFGAGIVLCALALLFVWLFIWFLGGAVAGFIRGLCCLGRKLCCKEVAVQ